MCLTFNGLPRSVRAADVLRVAGHQLGRFGSVKDTEVGEEEAG